MDIPYQIMRANEEAKMQDAKRENADRLFDELTEEILNVSEGIFPTAAPVDTSHATFTLSERLVTRNAASDSMSEEVITCPMARLLGSTMERPKYLKCRCCCVGEPHARNLTYKLIEGESILTEELHPGGLRKWFIIAVKPEPPMLAIVRLSKVSPIYYNEIETVSRNISFWETSPKRVFGMTARSLTLEMMQNDWGFPSSKMVKAVFHSFNTASLLPKPSNVTLKHFGMVQSPYMEKDAGQEHLASLMPQSYFSIFSKGSCYGNDAWEVRVTLVTRICHENNPLGRLVVTLQSTTLPQSQRRQITEDSIDFYFDLREDAQLFAAYLQVGQNRLREMFVHGPLANEKILDSRLLDAGYSRCTQGNSRMGSPIPAKDDTRAKMTFKLMTSQECGERRYRSILSREGYPDTVCINFKDKASLISQRGLLNSLQDLEIWKTDYDESGKPIASQISWEEFTRRRTKPRNLRATFIKSDNERKAGDWLDEIDDLIRTMRGDRNDPYEKVKIAIIDSGLHDRERRRYRAEYEDFTGVSTNDSWHGTCCAGIIQGIYEEARLYVARVFERDHADEIEGPLRMARVWAPYL